MKYRKKPVVIEAWKWDETETTRKMLVAMGMEAGRWSTHQDRPDECRGLTIITLEGRHIVSPGDYIIRGVKGEFYPCKPDIFEMTYEKVDEPKDERV